MNSITFSSSASAAYNTLPSSPVDQDIDTLITQVENLTICPPTLFELPAEIHEQIASYLSLNSVLQMRRTCWSLYVQGLSWISRDEKKLGIYLSHLISRKDTSRIDQLLASTKGHSLKTFCHVTARATVDLPPIFDKIQKKFPNIGIDLEKEELARVYPRMTPGQLRANYAPILTALVQTCALSILSTRVAITDRRFVLITQKCPNLRQIFLHSSCSLSAEVFTSFRPKHLEVLQSDTHFYSFDLLPLLERNPNNGVALTLLAMQPDISDQDKKMYLERALQELPRYAKAHECLGLLHYQGIGREIPDRIQAKQHLLEAYRIHPGDVPYIFTLASLFKIDPDPTFKDFTIARFLYHRVLEIDPTHSDAMLELAEMYLTGDGDTVPKQPKLAMELLKTAPNLQPTNKKLTLLTIQYGKELGLKRHDIEVLLRLAESRYPSDKAIKKLREEFVAQGSFTERAVASLNARSLTYISRYSFKTPLSSENGSMELPREQFQNLLQIAQGAQTRHMEQHRTIKSLNSHDTALDQGRTLGIL